MRNFIVLGVPRGGTSMIAGLLRIFGICMGTDMEPDKHEAHEFDKKTIHEIQDIIYERNRTWKEDWGFKSPWIGNFLKDVFNLFANPHYIFITRDLVASMHSDMKKNKTFKNRDEPEKWIWHRNLYFIKEIEKVLRLTNPKVLYVSFEESMKDPKGLVEKLEEFTGINLDKKTKERAIKFISTPGYKTIESIK